MSTGTTGAIRGGMAYVQAYLDDNPVTQGLAKLRGKLKSWQAGLSTLASGTMGGELPEPFAAIARFAQSPAGAFAALLGAAKFTAQAREEMLRMSETTGVSVEKLSQYAYAARRAGVSTEALANGLKRMQSKEFMAAFQGAGNGSRALKGITHAAIAQMGGGDATDKLREFIKLAENMPTQEKIGLARRLGLSELLPLINQGVDSLDAFTARAKQLGLVISAEDAEAGKKFEQAFGDLNDVLKSCVAQIGGALVPMITGLTNLIVPVVASIRDWIKNHKYLTFAIFAGTGAIVAGGIALKGFSVVAGLATTALRILNGAFTAASLVVGAFNVVLGMTQAIMGADALPFLLVGAAVLGVIGYIGYLAGAFSDLGNQWQGFTQDTTSSISAIANAISKGDLTAAWDVVTSYFRTEWQRLVNVLQEIWEAYRGYFTDAYYGMLTGWNDVCAKMKSAFENMITGVKNLWASWKEAVGSKFVGFFEDEDLNKWVKAKEDALRAKGVAFGGHVTTGEEELHKDMKGERKGNNAANASAQSQIEADRKTEELRIGAAGTAAAKARDARLAAAQAELDKRRNALKAAQDIANAPGPADKERPKPGSFTPEEQSAVAGTFSGAVAAMLGGGGAENLAQKQADLSADQLSSQWRMEALQREQLQTLSKIDANSAKAAEMGAGVI